MTLDEFRAQIRARWPEAKTYADPIWCYVARVGPLLITCQPETKLSWLIHSNGEFPCGAGATLDDAVADVRAELLSLRDGANEALAVLDTDPGDGREN